MYERTISPIIIDSLNRNRGDKKHTSPSPDIYPDVFNWDGCKITMLRARHGDPLGAVQELSTVLEGQDPDTGFIPNMRFATNDKWWDPERRTFKRPEFGSDYTQPPLYALAAWETYHALEQSEGLEHARQFLGTVYPKLAKAYAYFMDNREDNDGSSLIHNIHPHETGMDKNPGNDWKKWRLPTNGPKTPKPVAMLNAGLDYVSTLFLINRKLQAVDWDPQKAKDIFWLRDPMFNVVYADNLGVMGQIAGELGEIEDSVFYRMKAHQVGKEVIDTMWDKNNRLFYANNMGRIIDDPNAQTVSNLFPVILPEIRDDQLSRMLDLMEDPNWFATEYPFPSVPVYSKAYDPDYKEPGGIWRGPTWVNMNWLLVERGLLRHAHEKLFNNPQLANRCLEVALHVATKSGEMVQNGLGEFHHPHTGRSLRLENFAWANLGHDLGITARSLQTVFYARDERVSIPVASS